VSDARPVYPDHFGDSSRGRLSAHAARLMQQELAKQPVFVTAAIGFCFKGDMKLPDVSRISGVWLVPSLPPQGVGLVWPHPRWGIIPRVTVFQ